MRHLDAAARCPTSPHRYDLAMAENKETKTVGEHLVVSALARRGWAPALTRDGLERTDILAVATHDPERRMVDIQVRQQRAGMCGRGACSPTGHGTSG